MTNGLGLELDLDPDVDVPLGYEEPTETRQFSLCTA